MSQYKSIEHFYYAFEWKSQCITERTSVHILFIFSALVIIYYIIYSALRAYLYSQNAATRKKKPVRRSEISFCFIIYMQ
jgi:hypothetical protein